MGEGKRGGEGSVREGTFCCMGPCVHAVQLRCGIYNVLAILGTGEEYSNFEIWGLAYQGGKCGIFWAFLGFFA